MPSHQCYLGVRLLNSLAHLALKGKVQILDDDGDEKVVEGFDGQFKTQARPRQSSTDFEKYLLKL